MNIQYYVNTEHCAYICIDCAEPTNNKLTPIYDIEEGPLDEQNLPTAIHCDVCQQQCREGYDYSQEFEIILDGSQGGYSNIKFAEEIAAHAGQKLSKERIKFLACPELGHEELNSYMEELSNDDNIYSWHPSESEIVVVAPRFAWDSIL